MKNVAIVALTFTAVFVLGWGFRPPTYHEWLNMEDRLIQRVFALVVSIFLLSTCAGIVESVQ